MLNDVEQIVTAGTEDRAIFHSSHKDADPDHVTVDEVVIQLNNERIWMYATVDSETNHLLHVKP